MYFAFGYAYQVYRTGLGFCVGGCSCTSCAKVCQLDGTDLDVGLFKGAVGKFGTYNIIYKSYFVVVLV